MSPHQPRKHNCCGHEFRTAQVPAALIHNVRALPSRGQGTHHSVERGAKLGVHLPELAADPEVPVAAERPHHPAARGEARVAAEQGAQQGHHEQAQRADAAAKARLEHIPSNLHGAIAPCGVASQDGRWVLCVGKVNQEEKVEG